MSLDFASEFFFGNGLLSRFEKIERNNSKGDQSEGEEEIKEAAAFYAALQRVGFLLVLGHDLFGREIGRDRKAGGCLTGSRRCLGRGKLVVCRANCLRCRLATGFSDFLVQPIQLLLDD